VWYNVEGLKMPHIREQESGLGQIAKHSGRKQGWSQFASVSTIVARKMFGFTQI